MADEPGIWIVNKTRPSEEEPPARACWPRRSIERNPEFAAEARRQCLLANASPEEAEIQAFIDSVTEWPDDESTQ